MSSADIKRKTEQLLNRLTLQNEANRLVKTLPLGFKQKLAFSVSILHRPEVVFLDEPTGGVDGNTRRQFWELIYEAAQGRHHRIRNHTLYGRGRILRPIVYHGGWKDTRIRHARTAETPIRKRQFGRGVHPPCPQCRKE